MSKKNKKTSDPTNDLSTKEGKLQHLKSEIQKAQEEENEEYLKYLLRIQEMTINIYEGGVVVFQSGKPPYY